MFALAGGLVVGFLGGYLVFGYFGGEAHPSAPVTAATAAPVMMAPSLGGAVPGAAAPGGMSGALPAAPPSAEMQARISQIEAAVLADPKNHDAWVALGNDYFDTHQAQKAVLAYDKALALKPDDPNILTDQGVMYRNLGQAEKALANFQKANKLEPKHLQSLINIGVVYANDLAKPAEAAKAWNKVIATAPTSEQAAQARQMLAELKK
jgi:cytochrome c-type biogenesis protein CcmH/NrfG